MPLYKEINYNATTRVLLWKITETYDELFGEIVLNTNSTARLVAMQSEGHKKAYLGIRHLLKYAGYTDFDLYYSAKGKPFLTNKTHISITHSRHFAAIIISNEEVGIDIEMQRKKIIKIAHKFAQPELYFLNPEDRDVFIRKLTVIWGIKESIFKIEKNRSVSFNENIHTQPFELKKSKTKAELRFETEREFFDIVYEEIEGFTLVYAFRARADIY